MDHAIEVIREKYALVRKEQGLQNGREYLMYSWPI
jgi:hypothetical protein